MADAAQSAAPAVSVIVVNWNGGQVLPRCLAALRSQTYSDFEVIVVDNASADGSADALDAAWPGGRVERLARNMGFAAANNVGARLARGRWLALLNPDAFARPDWLACLVSAADAHPEYSFFASCLRQAGAPHLLDGAGDAYHVSGGAWRRRYGQPAPGAAAAPEEVFGPCAAAALYSREHFLASGGFDERFFCYLEDVDLAFRLRLQGQRCLYVPEAVVEHAGFSSHGAQSDFVVYHGHRNLVWTYFKNMPWPLLWLYLPAHLLLNLVSLAWFSLRGQARAIWRAKSDALLGLPQVLRQRRQVQRERRAPPGEVLRVMNRGWLEPYLGSRRRA